MLAVYLERKYLACKFPQAFYLNVRHLVEWGGKEGHGYREVSVTGSLWSCFCGHLPDKTGFLSRVCYLHGATTVLKLTFDLANAM